MDVKTLELLVEIARQGGFAAAARARGLDPSSVSRTAAQAEAALGLRLFQRTTRRLSLTEAGARYLARVEAVLEELARARDDAEEADARLSGTLRLTASIAFGHHRITPHLGAFRAAHPNLALELILTDAVVDMVAERVDLAVRLGPAVAGDAVVSKLMDTRYEVVASPDYLARAPALAAPADLAAHRCVLIDLPGFRSEWRFRDAGGAVETRDVETIAVAGDLILSSPLAVRQVALDGLGPALLADWLVDADLAEGRLVALFPDRQAAAGAFDTAAWLVYPSRAFLPRKTRAGVAFLRAFAGRRTAAASSAGRP